MERTVNAPEVVNRDWFYDAFERIRAIEEERFLEQLYEFFYRINTLDIAEVIAAYQAMMAYVTLRKMDQRHELFVSVKRALITRMVSLWSQAPVNQRQGLEDTFSAVVGISAFGVIQGKTRSFYRRDRSSE